MTPAIRLIDSGTTDYGLEYREYDCGNGLGASVTRGGITYGHKQGLWELAPIHVSRPGRPLLTPQELREILGWAEVRGWLSEDEITALLNEIAAKPRRD